MKNRKTNISSAAKQVQVMRAAVHDVPCPDYDWVTDTHRKEFNRIVKEKPKLEWTEHDLEVALALAMALCRLFEEEVKLLSEDLVLESGQGNKYANPRARMVSDLQTRIVKLRQTLGIHDRAKNGEPRDTAKRRATAFKVEANNPLEDDLLAKPSIQ